MAKKRKGGPKTAPKRRERRGGEPLQADGAKTADKRASEGPSRAVAAPSKSSVGWKLWCLALGISHLVAAFFLWLVVGGEFFPEVATDAFLFSGPEGPPPGVATSETKTLFAFYPFVYLLLAGAVTGVLGVLWATGRRRAPFIVHELYPPTFFLDTWKEIDAEALEERKKQTRYDWGPIVALCFGAAFLSVMEYFGGSRTFRPLLAWLEIQEPTLSWAPELATQGERTIFDFGWWSFCRVVGYCLLPMLLVKMMGRRVRDQGLETKGFSEHVWIYGFGYYVVLICVIIVSYTNEFSTYYPFYKLAHRSWGEFLLWELFYAAQFFSLEFFFRGWWVQTLKPMMGSHAIFAMVVPYCMIHFGKPFPETLAAIVAGLFLGTLAMKTRSIWSGFLIHVSVAISMDTASLLQGPHGLPEVWWPTELLPPL